MLKIQSILGGMAAAAVLLGGLSGAAYANPGMTTKHKLDCAACHVDGATKPASASQCLTCHKRETFGSNYELENGEANPHVPLHYDRDTIDCMLCHREHAESVNYCSACHADGLGFKMP